MPIDPIVLAQLRELIYLSIVEQRQNEKEAARRIYEEGVMTQIEFENPFNWVEEFLDMHNILYTQYYEIFNEVNDLFGSKSDVAEISR